MGSVKRLHGVTEGSGAARCWGQQGVDCGEDVGRKSRMLSEKIHCVKGWLGVEDSKVFGGSILLESSGCGGNCMVWRQQDVGWQ